MKDCKRRKNGESGILAARAAKWMMAGVLLFAAGCATVETAQYSVTSFAEVPLKAKAKIKIVANSDGLDAVVAALSGAFVKKGGFKVVDEDADYWFILDALSDYAPGGSQQVVAVAEEANDAGHGYASLAATAQGTEKVVIELELDLRLDCNPVEQEREYTLQTIPYKLREAKKKGEVPRSEVDAANIQTERVSQTVKLYETVASGTLKARFAAPEGKDCPQEYERTLEIAIPAADRFAQAAPSPLKALAAAVSPAVDAVVADISPYRESRLLVASEGGDGRVVFLLNAKAFGEVVNVVEKLELAGRAKAPDFENLGIAFEATGELFNAREAFKKAIAANPESAAAAAGAKRVEAALAGAKAVRDSGAKAVKDTKFNN